MTHSSYLAPPLDILPRRQRHGASIIPVKLYNHATSLTGIGAALPAPRLVHTAQPPLPSSRPLSTTIHTATHVYFLCTIPYLCTSVVQPCGPA
jgi:hypothetical protein